MPGSHRKIFWVREAICGGSNRPDWMIDMAASEDADNDVDTPQIVVRRGAFPTPRSDLAAAEPYLPDGDAINGESERDQDQDESG
jgi:hypothetical protein